MNRFISMIKNKVLQLLLKLLVAQTQQRICLECRWASIPSWGRSPEGGNGYPLKYSCLGSIPWTEEPRALESSWLQRVGLHWVAEHACASALSRSDWGMDFHSERRDFNFSHGITNSRKQLLLNFSTGRLLQEWSLIDFRLPNLDYQIKPQVF